MAKGLIELLKEIDIVIPGDFRLSAGDKSQFYLGRNG